MPHQTVDPGLMWRRGAMLLRLALGGLFIWTGLAKLQQPYEFLGALYNYELVGPQTGLLIARALPWLEVVIGVSLVGGAWCRGGAILAIALFSVFTVAQAMAAGEGLKIPCGCAVGALHQLLEGSRIRFDAPSRGVSVCWFFNPRPHSRRIPAKPTGRGQARGTARIIHRHFSLLPRQPDAGAGLQITSVANAREPPITRRFEEHRGVPEN